MKRLTYISIISFIFIVVNCSRENYRCKEIRINTQNQISDSRISSFCYQVNYIPLETSEKALLGLIQRTKSSSKRLYFLTGLNQEKIVAFDILSGRYIMSINSNGRGPGEYVRATDFIVSENDSIIEIYSRGLRKIIYYNSFGEFIKEKQFNRFVSSFFKLDSNYIFDIQMPNNRRVISLYDIDLTTESILYELPYYSYGDINSFSKFSDTISYCTSLLRDIYHFTSTGPSVAYRFDFLKNNIPDEVLNQNNQSVTELTNQLRNNNFAYNLYFYAESSDFIVATIHFEQSQGIIIYCKNSGNYKLLKSINDDFHKIPFDYSISRQVQPIILNDKILYFLMEPTIFFDKDNVMKRNWFTNIYNLNIDNNPIILAINLKNF
jgi:hypothetical protein